MNFNRTGNFFVPLEENQRVKVSTGDVLGWTTADSLKGGEISYSEIPEGSEIASEYEAQAETTIGNSITRARGSVKRQWHHMVSVHFKDPVDFYLYRNYSKLGKYVISSNITTNKDVYMLNRINKVTVACPFYTPPGHYFTINVTADETLFVDYDVDFGSGSVVTNQEGHFRHFYGAPGVYKAIVTARNALSSKSDSCSISILDEITNLAWRSPIRSEKIGDTSTFHWCVEKGTNLTYTINYGDGLYETVFAMGSENLCQMKTHKYSVARHYEVTLTADSWLGTTSTIKGTAIVQIPINDLSVSINLDKLNNVYFVATNDIVTVTASIRKGSDIECSFDFDDGSTYDVPKLSSDHSYSVAGSYHISVLCGNHISKLEVDLDTVVTAQDLENITGLSITANRTEFGKQTHVSAKMNTGTVFICEWNLGDGTIVKVDPANFEDIIYHDYRHIGDYNITLRCTNKLGNATATAIVHVDIPINGLGVSCPDRFTETNKKLMFFIAAESGSRLNVKVEFGDGIEDLFPHSFSNGQGINVTHRYDKSGEYFMKVRASNNINQFSVTCQYGLVVENPVKGITLTTNSPIKLSSGWVTIFFHIEKNVEFPTNAIVRYNFDNGTIQQNALRKERAVDGSVIKLFRYEQPGEYLIQVTIANNVSAIVYDLPIHVQKMRKVFIGFFQIQAGVFSEGSGADGNAFQLEWDVFVNVTHQQLDLQYALQLGDGSDTYISSVPIIRRAYTSPGTFNVSVVVDNVLQRMSAWQVLHIQESIKGVKMDITPIVRADEEAEVNITAFHYGTNSCVIIDFGVNEAFVFNKEYCENFTPKDDYEYQYFDQKFTKDINAKFVYLNKGSYLISVDVYNAISKAKVERKITILHRICKIPILNITGGGNDTYPRRLTFASPLVLSANISLFCDAAEQVVFQWSAYQVNDDDMYTTDNPIELTGEVALAKTFKMPTTRHTAPGFKIPEKTLPYGALMVQLKISFLSTLEDISHVVGIDQTWVHVFVTPLRVIIDGKLVLIHSTSNALRFGLLILFLKNYLFAVVVSLK